MSPRAPLTKPAASVWGLVFWVALAAVVAYLPILRNGFVYDDIEVLPANRQIGLLLHPSTYFSARYFDAAGETTYRPLVSLSYGLEYFLWGNQSPLGSHFLNLLLHALASALLVPVCLSLGAPRRVALTAGLLYAVHPLGSEAVCSTGFREDLLCAIFYLAAFALWPSFGWQGRAAAARGGVGRSGGKAGARLPEPAAAASLPLGSATRMGLAFLMFAMALLSKEMALSFPLLVLAKDLQGVLAGWRGNPARRAEFVHGRLPWHIAAWVLTAASLCLFLTFHSVEAGFVQDKGIYFPDASLLRRLAGFFWTGVRYLWLFVAPYPLSVEYIVPLRASWIWAVGGASGAVLAALCFLGFRKRAAFPAGWQTCFAFLALLGPVSNAIRLMHPMAERYLALPLAALCFLAAAALEQWRAELPRRFFLGGVLTALMLLSWNRCRDWESPLTLWGAEVRHGSQSCAAYNSYGGALANEQRIAEAIPYFEKAVQLAPDYHEPLSNLANAYGNLGQLVRAEEYLRRAIALDPGTPQDHVLLAVILGQTGRTEEALRECGLALQYGRTSPGVHDTVGGLLLRMNRPAEARPVLEKGLALARQTGDAKTERSIQETLRSGQQAPPAAR